jgi:hypothetical protein
MAKIQLTIKSTYLPKWGEWEGIRELVQNGIDAETEHKAPLKIDHCGQNLRLENEGCTLPFKALLLGHTSKLGRSDMRGQFGEGLKLGILALVRKGISVKIRNGSEVWTPTIEHSEQFDEPVLTFDVQGGRKFKDRVLVEIGCSKEAWRSMRERFLFVRRPKKAEVVECEDGRLLLGKEYKGCVFANGIFIQRTPELSYGYDLKRAELDRDRKMIAWWNLRYYTQKILLEAVSKTPSLQKTFYTMLEEQPEEVSGMEHCELLGDEAAQSVAAQFLSKYGADAVPVRNIAESADIEHLGKKGIVVNTALGAVLAKTIGDLETVKEELRKEVTRTYSWHELTDTERDNLTSGIALIDAVEAFSLSEVIVTDFRSADLQGQYSDGTVLIAKKHLVNRRQTLEILVHEVAHRRGGDGDKGHVAAIERIWSGIVEHLTGGKPIEGDQ